MLLNEQRGRDIRVGKGADVNGRGRLRHEKGKGMSLEDFAQRTLAAPRKLSGMIRCGGGISNCLMLSSLPGGC